MKAFATLLMTTSLLFTGVKGEHKEITTVQGHEMPTIVEEILVPEVFVDYQLSEKVAVKPDLSAFYVVNEPLNKRKTPNIDYAPIGYLAKGEPVKGVDILDNGWVKLSDGAFVNGKYITVQRGMTEETFNQLTVEFKKKEAERLAKLKEEQARKAAQAKAQQQQKQTVAAVASTGRGGITLSADEKDLLARLVRAEAGGESYEGMVAVASVVFNRITSGKFPTSVSGVIYARNQFQPVSNGSINKPASEVHFKAVEDALTRDNTNGALFFYAPSLVKSTYMESLATVAVIGTHHFKK